MKQRLNEAAILEDKSLVTALKEAKPEGKPMTVSAFGKWLAAL